MAWALAGARHPDWNLWIVGTGARGYVAKLRRLARHLGVKRVTFLGPLYGRDKDHIFDRADLYVLPTLTENFGISIAEALSHAVPAITTHGTPWSGLETNRCGWWIEAGPEALATALDDAMRLDLADLRAMGSRGRTWIEKDFSWKEIAGMTMRTYEWLRGGGPAPPWVHSLR